MKIFLSIKIQVMRVNPKSLKNRRIQAQWALDQLCSGRFHLWNVPLLLIILIEVCVNFEKVTALIFFRFQDPGLAKPTNFDHRERGKIVGRFRAKVSNAKSLIWRLTKTIWKQNRRVHMSVKIAILTIDALGNDFKMIEIR